METNQILCAVFFMCAMSMTAYLVFDMFEKVFRKEIKGELAAEAVFRAAASIFLALIAGKQLFG